MVKSKVLRVFVADDSAFIRERLPERLVDFAGVEIVGQASDGEKALASIRILKPDVAILDIRMPGKSGIEVLQELRKDESSPVIIMLTAYPYPQYRDKCMALGADFFLDKAEEFDKLDDILRQLSLNSTASDDM